MLTLDHSPVHSDPELMGGTLVFRGTRVPAQALLDYLNDGYSVDEFLTMFTSVHRDYAEQLLRLALNGALLARLEGVFDEFITAG